MFIYNVTIKDIIDGDTIKVDIDLGFNLWMNDQNIRLYGIDAPETRTKDIVEKKFGLLTKAAIERYLQPGSRCQMVSIMSQKGKFGRILGEFLVNDPDNEDKRFNLNRYLVEKRLAVPYTGKESRDNLKEAHHENRMVLYKLGVIE